MHAASPSPRFGTTGQRTAIQGSTQALLGGGGGARGQAAGDASSGMVMAVAMPESPPASMLSMSGIGGGAAAAGPSKRAGVYHPATGDPDMDRLFQSIQERIQQEQQAVENLQRTLEALTANDRLFDEADIHVTQQALDSRTVKLGALQQDYAEWQNLYQNMIASLEEKIKRKGEVLREVDAQFHTISNESALCEHFAQSQGQLQTGLAELKHTVRAAMLKKLDVQLAPAGEQRAPVYMASYRAM